VTTAPESISVHPSTVRTNFKDIALLSPTHKSRSWLTWVWDVTHLASERLFQLTHQVTWYRCRFHGAAPHHVDDAGHTGMFCRLGLRPSLRISTTANCVGLAVATASPPLLFLGPDAGGVGVPVTTLILGMPATPADTSGNIKQLTEVLVSFISGSIQARLRLWALGRLVPP